MVNTGDELICTDGNNCYVEGYICTIGNFINERFFEVMTGNNKECWYARKDNEGIYVAFDAFKRVVWFDKLEYQVGT